MLILPEMVRKYVLKHVLQLQPVRVELEDDQSVMIS